MEQPQAYLDGRWLPASELAIPVYDSGFVLGTTITEQLRTFGGRIFRLEEHLARMFHSLEIVGVDPGLSRASLADLAREAVDRNHRLLAEGDDLGVGMFVTPGPYASLGGLIPADARATPGGPTLCVHTHPLQFQLWADRYREGQSVVVSDVRQVPSDSWPTELKCRSRMHYHLADLHAAEVESGARAILLDRDGCVNEATTANVLLYRAEEGIVSPPPAKILPGVSLATLAELAAELDIPFGERDIAPEELATADELWLTSTSVCVLPVDRCNGRQVGGGCPGPVFGRLLDKWGARVGLDIAAQARRFASR